MTRALVILLGFGVLGVSPAQQSWTDSLLNDFLAGPESRTWTIKAKKGRAEFAEILLEAKFTFRKNGKLIIRQPGGPEKTWNWTLLRDADMPAGYQLRLNGTGFQVNPVRISSATSDKLTLTSLDSKMEIPAKIYMVSPRKP